MRELGLKPGQKLLVSVKAADLCDLGHGPNVAGSERWLLDVVTPEQLRAMLEARELVLRQRFEQMIQEMTETRDLLARMQFESDKPADSAKKAMPKATANEGLRLATALTLTLSQRERGHAGRQPSRATRSRPIRPRGSAICVSCACRGADELPQGRARGLGRRRVVRRHLQATGQQPHRHRGTEEPAARAASPSRCTRSPTKMFPELDRRLEELQSALDDCRARPRAPRRAPSSRREEILLAMQKVRDRMIELEDFNEAVELLRNIVEMQKQLHEQTEQRHKEKIRDLLKE